MVASIHSSGPLRLRHSREMSRVGEESPSAMLLGRFVLQGAFRGRFRSPLGANTKHESWDPDSGMGSSKAMRPSWSGPAVGFGHLGRREGCVRVKMSP